MFGNINTRVFFSYARTESAFVLELGQDLRRAGIDVWLDQLDITPGERWDVAIEQALGACSRMLVILTPTSVASTNVLDEVSFALDQSKQVIPILQLDCSVPFRLRRLQYVDFRNDYASGLAQLRAVLEARTPDGSESTLQSAPPERTSSGRQALSLPAASVSVPPRASSAALANAA